MLKNFGWLDVLFLILSKRYYNGDVLLFFIFLIVIIMYNFGLIEGFLVIIYVFNL